MSYSVFNTQQYVLNVLVLKGGVITPFLLQPFTSIDSEDMTDQIQGLVDQRLVTVTSDTYIPNTVNVVEEVAVETPKGKTK